MTTTRKLAHKRLTLLQLAEKLGNVSKACRMHKVSRSQFYEYKRSFQEHGLEGLVDKPPIPLTHPNQLPKKTKARIIALSLEHPAFGQQRIADQMALEGFSICATSVRNVWKKEDLETKYKRLLKLDEITIGIDRGVTKPVQAGEEVFDFSTGQKKNKTGKEKYLKRLQRRLAKQKKGSNRRFGTKRKICAAHTKIANIRRDFCHKTSRALVNKKDIKVYIFEDLKTKTMSASAKGTVAAPGKNIKAKSGLNRSILDKGWHMLEAFTKHKAYRAGKVVFKVPAHHTSQECADCGNTDNADNNAQKVIKKRAINLILGSGTELSKRGVLLDTGRGTADKSHKAKAICARSNETSKKMRSQLLPDLRSLPL